MFAQRSYLARASKMKGCVSGLGFTLIELLVVISIIALLIGILLPALTAARDVAKGIKCLSSQRQVGLSLLTYANDYDGMIPAVANTLPWPDRYWTSRLLARNYISAADPLYCPSWTPFTHEEAVAKWPARPWVSEQNTYGLRAWAVPNTPGDPMRDDRRIITVEQPSDFFILADSYLLDNGSQYYGISGTPTDNFRKMVHARHGGVANALYLDGSARGTEPEYFLSLSTTQAKYRSDFVVFEEP